MSQRETDDVTHAKSYTFKKERRNAESPKVGSNPARCKAVKNVTFPTKTSILIGKILKKKISW